VIDVPVPFRVPVPVKARPQRFIVAMPPARYAVDEDEIYVPPVADAYGEYRSANTESEWVPVGR